MNNDKPEPVFIVIEGTDGAGKTTQVSRLAARMEKACVHTAIVHDPGIRQGNIAMDIRKIILEGDNSRDTETLLFLAARSMLCTEMDRLMGDDTCVISDRYDISTMVYQGMMRGRADFIQAISKLLDFTKPDLRILLDVPTDIALARMALRGGGNRFDKDGMTEKRREAYRQAVGKYFPDTVMIDASGKPEEVEKEIWKTVFPFLLCRSLV
jgi:dTMP kinase